MMVENRKILGIDRNRKPVHGNGTADVNVYMAGIDIDSNCNAGIALQLFPA